MMITDVHSQQLENYLNEQILITGKSCSQLYDQISTNQNDMVELVNAVVVNETYFFREEKQFKLLQEYLQNNFANKNVVIWSAACSTGEEPYSLAAMALSCGTNPVVYATDIDTDALQKLKNGVYGQNSFRPDGACFKQLISPYITEITNNSGQTNYLINSKLKEKIMSGRANLMEFHSSTAAPHDETVDIIFIRNVFIYFDKESREKILKALTKKLKNGGLIFFSISEIGGINPNDKNLPLLKRTKNSIYYFEKTFEKAAPLENKVNPIENRKIEELIKNRAADNQLILEAKSKISVQENAKPKEEIPLTPEQMWEKITVLIEKRNYVEARSILNSYTPSVNQLCIKYYCLGFLYEAQKETETALEYYEKSGLSNPHFWPGDFQSASVLLNSKDASAKRKRHDALIKTATILENEETESEKYTYLMGAFSSSYFYQLCNEYIKKELV